MSPEWKYLYLTCSDRTKRWAQVALAAVSVVAVLGLVLATHLQPHNTLGQGEDTWILELQTRVREDFTNTEKAPTFTFKTLW